MEGSGMSNTVRMRKKSEYDIVLERINSPAHYTQGEIECIDAIEASMPREQFIGFLKGNEMKYNWRFDTKGIHDGMTEDEKMLVKFENLGKGEFYKKRLMRMHTPAGIGTPEYEAVEVKNA
jgi:hypothetical protein